MENTLNPDLKSNWTFINGDWTRGPDGMLSVPEKEIFTDGEAMQGHHYAIDRHLTFGDIDLSFDFRLRPHSDIGIILRSRSPQEFHLLHLPNCGQAFRAKHFWACLSRMEEGFLRLLKLEMIRRVPSTSGIWLRAQVSLRGDTLTMGIGNHGTFVARDPEMPDSGHLGLYSFGPADIKGLILNDTGESRDPGGEVDHPPRNWFHPLPPERKVWQRPGDLVRTPGGDLLLPFSIARDTLDREAKSYLLRSRDGASWSTPKALDLHVSSLHVFPDGEMRIICQEEGKFLVQETKDDGESWTPGDCLDVPDPPEGVKELYLGPQGFLNLKDGTVLMLAYGRHDSTQEAEQVYTWSAFHCQAFASRSEDGGWTYSEWKNIDGEKDPTGKPVNGCMDLTEVCAAQVSDGRVIALVRPIYSPWMWETWSNDGGRTWEPCVRGAFPGYATPNICRTRSGFLLVAHRLPGCTINTSRDDGATWDQGTMIDSAIWVMGSMLEVEEDLVLYAYYDSFMGPMRAQFIRATEDVLLPERRW